MDMSFFRETGIAALAFEPMSKHTSFCTGGPADLLVFPKNEEEIASCVSYFHQTGLPCLVLGNCSNVVVSDLGIEGAVLLLGKDFSELRTEGSLLFAKAGAKLSQAVSFALKNGLTGLEFAGGIPGTVGGGVYMNAGAYGGELASFIKSVTVLTEEGKIKTYDRAELSFSYRHSPFMDNREIILFCAFLLERGDAEAARETLSDLNRRRREKQPLEYPSAGSVFKRPEGNFAGTLIERAGLKGYSVGGAQVSQKHAGFIVNTGGAASADILAVVAHVQQTVKEKFGVKLEPEIRFIGRGA